MPCWEVKIESVEFTSKYKDLFEKTIKSLNLSFFETVWEKKKIWVVSKSQANLLNGDEITIWPDEITIWPDEKKAKIKPGNEAEYQPILNEMRRMYAFHAVKMAASQKKWNMTSKSVAGKSVMTLKKAGV